MQGNLFTAGAKRLLMQVYTGMLGGRRRLRGWLDFFWSTDGLMDFLSLPKTLDDLFIVESAGGR